MVPHSYLNLISPNWLSFEVFASLNPIKVKHADCNLLMGIYIIQEFKILLPNSSHFNLSQCQSPICILYFAATIYLSSIRITHLLPKQFPISIFILIHLPSKLFICSLFALNYTPFNLSLFFFVSFYSSFYCNFISSS